jgi:hypothetical protein
MVAFHPIVALETRLNEQESGNSDQRTRSRRRTNSSNSDEDGGNEKPQVTQVTQVSPLQVTALTPVSMDVPPWSAPMFTPAVSMEPVVDDVSQAIMPVGMERVPVALHLTSITCSDL